MRLRVSDTGVGIAPEHHERIFENSTGFRTRTPRSGRAPVWGWHSCGDIVRLHGGSVWVESSQGAGATFVVELPTAGSVANAQSKEQPMSRIVIAEDSVHIRNVLAMWMSRNGHDVFPAPDGRVALELLRDQPVDFLVTDLAMPGMDGAELAGVAFGVCPTLRWVFVVSSRCDQHEVLAGLADPRISCFRSPSAPHNCCAS